MDFLLVLDFEADNYSHDYIPKKVETPKIQGDSSYSSSSKDSLDTSFDSFCKDDNRQSQESKKGFLNTNSLVKNVKRDLEKLKEAEQSLKVDVMSLHHQNPQELLVS